MNTRKILLALAALFALAAEPALAASQMLCATAAVPRRVVNTSSTAATQPSYQLNARGCAVIAQADVGFFLTQGFTPGPNENSLFYISGVQASGTGDLIIGSVPPGAYIQQFIIQNTIAAAVTGGVDIGTTANGVDVASAFAVGSSALTFITDALLLKRVFSLTAATPIHIAAHTGWNGANLTITVVYGYF